MGEQRSLVRAGAVTVVGSPAGVAAVVITGFVSFPVLAQVLDHAERALAEEPEPSAVVLDVLGIEGFEPGVPARVIHWLGAHSDRVAVAGLITTRPVLQALVRAAEVMVP